MEAERIEKKVISYKLILTQEEMEYVAACVGGCPFGDSQSVLKLYGSSILSPKSGIYSIFAKALGWK